MSADKSQWGADTFRFNSDSKLDPDLSLPSNTTDLGLITTEDGIQCRIYVEHTAYTTMIIYHSPLTKSKLLYWKTYKKSGGIGKGTSGTNPCKSGEVKKNNISASNCIKVELITKEIFDTLKY